MTDIIQISKGGKKFYPQTKVQAVLGLNSVGTNLYQDTRDFENPSIWGGWSYWYKTGEKFNGLTVMATDQDWNGLRQSFSVKNGATYTFSVYARYKSGTGTSAIIVGNNSVGANPNMLQVSLDTTWKRVSSTISVAKDGMIDIGLVRFSTNKNTLLVAGIKLEKGPVMTDYSVNPEDISTSEDVKAKIAEQIKANQPDLSGFQKASDVQTAIASALGKIDVSQTMNDSIRNKLQTRNKETGS